MGFVGFIGKNGRILNDNFSCYENSDASVCHLTLLNKQFKIITKGTQRNKYGNCSTQDYFKALALPHVQYYRMLFYSVTVGLPDFPKHKMFLQLTFFNTVGFISMSTFRHTSKNITKCLSIMYPLQYWLDSVFHSFDKLQQLQTVHLCDQGFIQSYRLRDKREFGTPAEELTIP